MNQLLINALSIDLSNLIYVKLTLNSWLTRLALWGTTAGESTGAMSVNSSAKLPEQMF